MDYQSSTPLDERVYQKMLPFLTENFGNPHSTEHVYGWEANKAIERARTYIASFIDSFEEEIIFTSGATESNNLAIIGTAYAALDKLKRRTILVSAIEHKCVLGAARFLQKLGFKIEKIPVLSNGKINLEKFTDLLTPDVLLVSVMASNNEIGVNQPLQDIGLLCRENGSLFHVDAAQGIYTNINVIENNIDLLSLSAHKIYGPKGIGALFISQDSIIKPYPIIHGGGQQNGFRSGTLAPALVIGIGEAFNLLTSIKTEEIIKIRNLRDSLLKGLKEKIAPIIVNGDLEDRHPGNLNLTIPNVNAQQLILSLQPHLAFSTGSACTSGIPEPSHVLKAIGLTTEAAENSFRITVGRFSLFEEIERAIELITDKTNSILNN